MQVSVLQPQSSKHCDTRL